MDLFDKVTLLLGEEQMSIREYTDILDAGFSAAKVGMIPPGNDRVTVGDIERTRLNHIRILFFVGVNEWYRAESRQHRKHHLTVRAREDGGASSDVSAGRGKKSLSRSFIFI